MNGTARSLLLTAVVVAAAGCHDVTEPPREMRNAERGATLRAASAVSNLYVAEFVATAATAVGMNAAGDVIGHSRLDPGCGPFCLPPEEAVVWRGGNRIVLPGLPGFAWTGIYPKYINRNGWIAGVVGSPYSNTRAVVWRPNGGGYAITDLGTLPGTAMSQVAGIDDQGRIVGWAMDAPTIPRIAAPFVWTQATGMVDLSANGFPKDMPLAVSPGGHVATYNYHYQLGDPGSVAPMPAPPSGFLFAGDGTAVNDAGGQARFLVSTSTQNLVYLFRFDPASATYQQIWPAGNGRLSRYGMGSITAGADITATMQTSGLVARGPAGSAQLLTPLLASSYAGATSTMGGTIVEDGSILTRLMIGRSERVMRMVPANRCTSNCAIVSSLVLTAKFVQEKSRPGSCYQGGKARNDFSAQITVKSEAGTPLAGAQVRGRFLDDYWMDMRVSGTTNRNGVVQLKGSGPCGVGAIAFFVDDVVASGRTFDRAAGVITAYQIPN